MKTKRVISRKNLPAKSPILATVVYIMAMDYWNAPQWFWGAFGLVLLTLWIGWIWALSTQKSVTVFDDDKDEPSTQEKYSKFREKLLEKIKEQENR